MITKATIKLVKSLKQKKFRKETGLFVVEGEKSIIELLGSDFEIVNLFITAELRSKYFDKFNKYRDITEIFTVKELEGISSLEYNDTGLAVVKQKENTPISFDGGDAEDEIIIVLDDIRDPGNLGTIIRTADWYGIKKIICSNETSEFYNQKVIASTMGSFTRIQIYYTDLEKFFLNNEKNNVKVIGALLDGKSAHDFKYPKSGILFMGSESNGIHKNLLKYITDEVTIPKYGQAESLNVSMATGILLDNWKRN